MLEQFLKAFTPDLLSLVVIVGFFVALVAVAAFFNAARKTEFFKSNELFMQALAQKAMDLILHVEYGNEYTSVAEEYETKAQERVTNGLFCIDPRMLFVIDKLETFVNQKFNVHLEFDDLLAVAESKFNQLENDPSNTLLNSK